MTIDRTQTVGARLESALDEFFTDRVRAAATHGPEFEALWARTAEHAGRGKLLRPLLFLDTVEAFDAAADPATVDGLGVALEVLHYAFLLHDDVIDGDLMRRHRPNLVGTLKALHPEPPASAALHWGTSSAILMGDMLLSAVVLCCGRLALPADVRNRVLDLLEEAIGETVAGEHLDVGLSDGAIPPALETVMRMTAMKTATYSFALPLRLAAALAGADAEADQTLARAGRDLGFAFQVQDDLLSMVGDPAAHGKDAVSDLREGKETVLISFLRATPHWDEVAVLFGDPRITQADADRVRAAIEASGAREFAEDLVADRRREAIRTVDQSSLPGPVRRVVAECAERIEGRTV